MSFSVRSLSIVVHRWVGLVMAVFLLLAGVTGSVLAFYADLDAALNPELFRVAPPASGARLLDPIELRERVQAQLPEGKTAGGVILELLPEKSANFWIDERETFVDPYSGKILGSRRFGDLTEGKKNLLTFIYRFHYSLALGDVGTWLFGGVALLWTLDCFVGAYLTFPRGVRRTAPAPAKSWLARWLPAWLLKTNKLFSFVFTWHRASGLWVWGMLLVFAWSGVALNLGEQVYQPVMNVIFPGLPHEELPKLDKARAAPELDWRKAREVGRALMRTEAAQGRFQILREDYLDYDAERGAYAYTVESTLDIDRRLAETTLSFDGDTGKRLAFHAPTGSDARHTLDAWLVALHFGAVRPLGTAYRVFVCVLGIMVAALSVTGVWIWWRKRTKRSSPLRSAPSA